MEFLIVNLGEVGKFTAIVLLILQLTACGGTFPMELVPGFFNKISPVMPMTYSVNSLKEVISGVDYGFLYSNLAVLAGITIAFFAISALVSRISEKMKADIKNTDKLTA
jgi:putative membrane protein